MMPLHYFSHIENTNRPPLIFLHGAGGNYLSWPAHMRRMKGQTIYAPDLSGHGKSPSSIRTTIHQHADDILELLDSLKIQRITLAGHSMGGAIALSLALEHPERIEKLILISSGATLRVSSVLLEASSKPETFQNTVNMIVENSFHPAVDARLKELTLSQMLTTSQATLHADLAACSAFNVLDSLPRVSARTLILCGADDKMAPPKLSQTLHESIPNSRLEIVPDAGHFLMQEKETVVTELIQKFLEK